MAKRKSKAGRKRKIDEKIVRKLVEGFQNDFTIEEACRYAGISKDTYYQECKRSPTFADEMSAAQDFPLILAKKRVFKEIRNSGSGDIALKLLERRQRDRYSPKLINEHTGSMTVGYRELEKPATTAKTVADARKMSEKAEN